jgi:hypothetical protein
MNRKLLLVGLGLFGAGLILAACAGAQGPAGPAGPPGPAGPVGPAAEVVAADLTCTECHNDTALISGKLTSWEASRHGSGTAHEEAGANPSCAGCHSGGGFSDRIAAGITNPDTVETADPNPSRIDCRTCHQIHTTYTDADWALETTAPVALYAVEGSTFDGGEGNLCVNCHQPRRVFPAAENGVVSGITSHWGPHHGPQSAMLLGVGGAGVQGTPGPHYSAVENTCVGCHMGSGQSHTFMPDVATCQACHADAENFDIDGVQTQIQAMGDQLGEMLLAAGLINENSPDGHPTVTEAPENQAIALYNWLYVMHEDKSLGVHNPDYARALLQAGLDAMGQ